jgi:hypothetical protein
MNRRKKKLQHGVATFIRQYQRKANANDPNDRGYSRRVERLVKRMKPEEPDELLHGDDDTGQRS